MPRSSEIFVRINQYRPQQFQHALQLLRSLLPSDGSNVAAAALFEHAGQDLELCEHRLDFGREVSDRSKEARQLVHAFNQLYGQRDNAADADGDAEWVRHRVGRYLQGRYLLQWEEVLGK